MTLVPPAVAWDASPLKCLSVNDEWVSFLTGMLWLGEQDWYWDAQVDEGVQGTRSIIEALSAGECPPVTIPPNIFVAKHTAPSGTQGGGYTAPITAIPYAQVSNVGSYITDLGGGLFQAQLGTYHFRARQFVLGHNTNVTNFRLMVAFAPLFVPSFGDSVRRAAGERGYVQCQQVIVIANPANQFRVQLGSDQTRATNGLGASVGDGLPEEFGVLEIVRLL